MYILTTFNMLILVLLTVYVFYRLMKTKSILTLISFTLQLSALTIVLLSIINQIETSSSVNYFYLTFGIVFPCSFLVFDYHSMIKKVKEKGSFEGFITVDRNSKIKNDNSTSIMSIDSNDAFISETISELGMQKEDLLKGIKKKLVLAEAYNTENKYDEAYEIYNNLISLFGTSSNLYFNYGNICFKKGLLSEALSNYRKVLELNELFIQKLKKTVF
ncbi:MAG: tetratricopeptide repeat protein, partial [Ruminiclostridium sp.]